MAMSIPEPVTQAHEGETVAQHIARAAARLFAARGYDATSVREIVAAAGVTKPTLYYHFKSKEGLAQALLIDPMNRLIDELGSEVEAGGEPVATLTRMVERIFAFSRDDPDRSRFVYALFFGPLGSGLAAEMARLAEQMDEVWGHAADRLAEAGVIAAERATDCAANLRGLIVVHTVEFLYRGGQLGPELACRLVGDLLDGLRARGPEPGRTRGER